MEINLFTLIYSRRARNHSHPSDLGLLILCDVSWQPSINKENKRWGDDSTTLPHKRDHEVVVGRRCTHALGPTKYTKGPAIVQQQKKCGVWGVKLHPIWLYMFRLNVSRVVNVLDFQYFWQAFHALDVLVTQVRVNGTSRCKLD